MSVYLFCTFDSESRTPNRLAKNLGAVLTKSTVEPVKPSVLIRWGTTEDSYVDSQFDDVFNTASAISRNMDKKRAARILSLHVSTPKVYFKPSEIKSFPVLARDVYHSNGSDVILVKSKEELIPSSHYVSYIPKKREFRVHAMRGDVFLITEKRPRKRSRVCWNSADEQAPKPALNDDDVEALSHMALASLRALRLDFGAVDVIQSAKNQDFYVLEVNTGPWLESTKPYVQAFNTQIGEYYKR